MALALALALLVGSATASAPLASLLVRPTDLKYGYRQVFTQYTRSPWAQNGNPIDRRGLTSHHFVMAYRAQFDDSGTHPQPTVTVSRILQGGDRFRDAAGARWGYRQEVAGTYVQAKRLSMPHVGDESVWFSAFLPEPPPYEITVIFRRGAYVVRIAVDKGAYSRSAVLDLARLVDSRIMQNG
jgi:hypothetical protein